MSDTLSNALGNVLIVGGGRMGQAIASGMLRIEGFSPRQITVANPGEEKRRQIESTLGIKTVECAASGLPADCVIIAVKPKNVSDVCTELVRGGIGEGTLVISIAAGISTSTLVSLLGNKLPVVRVMPNTPLVCGQGMSAVSAGKTANATDCQIVCDFFASMGKAIIVEEELQDVVCAVSGSGPAYYELFTEIIARTAQELGLPYDTAVELALQTMLGTAQLMQTSGQSLQEAIDAVSSPGGTTVAALGAMRSHGVEQAISQGVIDATKRSRELGS